VVVDTSSDDSEFVEQNEIQDPMLLKHRTPRKSARGARGQGAEAPPLAGELSFPSVVILSHPHRSATVDVCHPRQVEAIINRPSSFAI
jgi:hypothetical protein